MYRLYLYVCVVTRILDFCAAGLDGTFLNTLYERFKEGPTPTHFTPAGKAYLR